MARKLILALSLVVLAGALTGSSFANVIQITLGQSTAGTAWAGSTGASFVNVSGYAYQGTNAGTFWLSDATYTGTGCDMSCTVSSSGQTVMVTIGPDMLMGTLYLTKEGLGALLKGTMLITSSTPGFASTGYSVGQYVGADITVTSPYVSSGQIQTDAVPEPSTMAMLGSGLLAVAGFLRRKL